MSRVVVPMCKDHCPRCAKPDIEWGISTIKWDDIPTATQPGYCNDCGLEFTEHSELRYTDSTYERPAIASGSSRSTGGEGEDKGVGCQGIEVGGCGVKQKRK